MLFRMPPILFSSQTHCSMGTTAVVLKLLRPTWFRLLGVHVKLFEGLKGLVPSI